MPNQGDVSDLTKENSDLVKSNKSMAQQNIDLQEQIKDLQILLRKREATIQGVQNILGNIMNAVETQVNKAHRKLVKDVVDLTDTIGEQFNNALDSQFKQLGNLSPENMRTLSMELRRAEGLPPLYIPDENPQSQPSGQPPSPVIKDVNKSKKG